MGERDCVRVLFEGLTFRFYFDRDRTAELHIGSYGVGVEDVLEAFMEGERTWDSSHDRWVSRTANHILYWAWYGGSEESQQVVVISGREV